MKVDEKILGFLLSFPYPVVHEADVLSPQIEHFFVGFDKADVRSDIVQRYIETHKETFPLVNLSHTSMNYLSQTPHLHYLLVDSLDKTDVFYPQKARCIQNNVSNILAIKWIGEPIDMSSHVLYNAEKYMSDFKDISSSMGMVAKEKIKTNLLRGRTLLEEKKPAIQQKIKSIFKKM